MNKAQKIIVGFFIISILVIATLFLIYLNKPVNIPSSQEIVFYYGITCPHCKIVEQWMADNNFTQKINITQKEVYENQTNAKELIAVGALCKIEKQYIGAVPMIYSEGKCYLGDVEAIKFLKTKMGVN
jgi:glutaredoxin